MGNIAPWSDLKGNQIMEGDIIKHPSGEKGTVIFIQAENNPNDQWRVDYGDGVVDYLCLQIGDKGMATVTHQGDEQ